LILCGEHAVVYGQPAIALPLPDIRATALVEDAPIGSGITIATPDIGEEWTIGADGSAPHAHPLATLVRITLAQIGGAPDVRITLRSAIPIASGMGSGAALGAALVKALAAHLGATLGPDVVARLVYESERFYHGTPSGIDNTVVSYEQAIWFVRSPAGADPPAPQITPITIGQPFTLVVGDTGVRAPTHVTVGGVRERWQRDPARYQALFETIGQLARRIRSQLAEGNLTAVGQALNENQTALAEIGVSSPELERLIDAARGAGALGAKLSGGGGGGIMVALTDRAQRAAVAQALLEAGASQVMQTTVTGTAWLS
jgi:mevalonate kinase